MNKDVDLKLLKKHLLKAKPEEPKETICSFAQEKTPEMTEQLRYLIANVFNPLCRGERVNTGDLDFSRFDCADLSDLQEFYERHCRGRGCDWEMLKNIFDTCNHAAPEVMPTVFI